MSDILYLAKKTFVSSSIEEDKGLTAGNLVAIGGGGSGSAGTSGIGIYNQGTILSPTASALNFQSGIVGGTSSTSGIVDVNIVYDTNMDPTMAMPFAVGGIAAGTTAGILDGNTVVQMFDSLLFPTVYPTYTVPTIVLSNTVSGIAEIGSTVNPALGLVGTKNDAGSFTFLSINRNVNGVTNTVLNSTGTPASSSAASIPAQFGYADPNNPNYAYTLTHTDTSYIVPIPSSGNSSLTSYSGTGSYDVGLVKKDNKGVNDTRSFAIRSANAPQSAASNFGSNVSTITGYYPYFYGKTLAQKTASEIKTIIESGSGYTKVVNNSAGSISMAFNAVGEWPWFAIFSGYTTKTAWYENALNQGSIGASTDLFASPSTLSISSPDGYWIVNYKIYPANKVTTLGTAQIS